MSVDPDGSYSCDRCGADVQNGAITVASVAGDLIEVDGGQTVVNYHFCRDREENGEKVLGCTRKVLSARNLEHYKQTKESRNEERADT